MTAKTRSTYERPSYSTRRTVIALAASWLDGTEDRLRPPAKVTLSQWADRHFRLSAESSAEPGRWRTLPYQRGVLDAITDPSVERVTWKKSARVGATKCINAAIAYYIAHDPCPILLVQPTVEDAQGYSKEEIAPMLRDVEVLRDIVQDSTVKKTGQTILEKTYPGGVLGMVGANSGRGFRRVSRRVVIFDEVDGYPPSAGADGDPIKLGERRSEYYWNRKIIAASTPLVAGVSRIEELFLAGDRRRYYVPCPHCSSMDFLRFRMKDGDGEEQRGHRMRWEENRPETARFICSANRCEILETDKRTMIERGEWRADLPFHGHASFHIWSAYSLSPNASWSHLVAEFLESKSRPETLRTFVNTVLGETWQEQGDAPEWERLFRRRDTYAIGTVPDGAIALTSGVDVQKDRLVYEVVAWDAEKRSSSVEAGILWGDTSLTSTWTQLDVVLDRQFPGQTGAMSIAMMAVDSGYNTQAVYAWCRSKPMNRVIATKGVAEARMLIATPTAVDVTLGGRRMRLGYKVWPVGVHIAKSELYGWLRLEMVDGAAPPGYCRFPEYDEEYFRQLTAEQLVTIVNRRTRRATLEWQCAPNRENHYLDCRVYARAAVALLGIDRIPAGTAPAPPRQDPGSGRLPLAGERKATGFWGRGSRGVREPRSGSWLGRRR